jgi:acyl carrier protein
MNNYFEKIRDLVVEKTGMDPAEINEDSFFEDDLNISELELLEILSELEEDLQIEIIPEKEDIESVGDLIDIISEKLE